MKWIRLWVEETLEGSTFDEMGSTLEGLAFRGVWFSLLALAGSSPVPGKICFTEDTGFTLNQIAKKLKVDKELLKKALEFLKSDEVNKIKVENSSDEIIIEIVNWNKYQTEYERQKKYRQKGLQVKVTGKSYTTDEDEDEEDIDKDKDKKKTKTSSHTPYKKIVGLYNEICKSLPKVVVITDKRKEIMRVRWKKYPKLEVYQALFEKAEESDFLSGRNGKWLNCSFDWLINENNMIKVLEGNYDNRARDKGG